MADLLGIVLAREPHAEFIGSENEASNIDDSDWPAPSVSPPAGTFHVGQLSFTMIPPIESRWTIWHNSLFVALFALIAVLVASVIGLMIFLTVLTSRRKRLAGKLNPSIREGILADDPYSSADQFLALKDATTV
jgi:hypothetical protein